MTGIPRRVTSRLSKRATRPQRDGGCGLGETMGVTDLSGIVKGVRRVRFARRLRARLLVGWLAACIPSCMALYLFLGELAAAWVLAVYVAATVGVVLWEANLKCPRCGKRLEGIRSLAGLPRESEKACRHCSLRLGG